MMPDANNKKLVAEQSFAGYEFSAYMGGKGMDKSLVNKARRILASVLIAALCVCNMAMPAFAEEAVAASFRLYQTEGTVTVQNQNRKEMTAMQDMKLFNGYQISTEQKSYAWFEADSTKLFKMDAVSNLEVRKKGKQSELLLNSGNLFFNVTEHLQDDEVLNIRTSSMVVGIRGTSGWVKVIDQYHTILYMLEGSVEASVTDPVSGQRKSITLRGGQRAEFWIYDKNKEGDKCDIIVRQYGEEEIDGFVAVELKKNPQLQDRIRGGGGSGAGGSAGGGTGAGFDLVSTIAKAEERLKQDQEEVARKLEEIKKQLAGLAHKVDVDPVFSNNTSKDDSGSDGGASGGSATETVADPTTLTMPVDDITVHDYLNNKKVSVILQPSANANENNFAVANGLTVPSGKSLTIQNGISTSVESGKTLQVDGHMETAGNLTNTGTVNNTSTNTLQIAGNLDNAGMLDNSTGRLIVKRTFSNSGTLITGNIIENNSAAENTGTFTVTGGTVGTVNLNNGGTLNVNSGTISDVVENGGTLQLNGGTIGNLTISSKEIDISRGTVENVKINGGGLIVNGGTTNEVNMPGNGKIILKSGNGGDLTIVQGTVEVQDGATLKHVDIQGGTFKLNGGTILNGVTQSSETANVYLNKGTVKAGDSIAVNIKKGIVEFFTQEEAGELNVSADSTKNLINIEDGAEAKVGISATESLTYNSKSVILCQPESQTTSLEQMKGPYRLTGFSYSLVDELKKYTLNPTIYVMLTDEIIGSKDSEKNEEIDCDIVAKKQCCIELNGHILTLNAKMTVGYDKQEAQSLDENMNGAVAVLSMDDEIAIQNDTITNDATWLTIINGAGTGMLVLNNDIQIADNTTVLLKDLKMSRKHTARFLHYGPMIDHVTVENQQVTEKQAPPPTEFIYGYINKNIDSLIYEDIPNAFFRSDGLQNSKFTLENSTLTTNRNAIFDFSSYKDSDNATVEIEYQGKVLLSNAGKGIVFDLGGSFNGETKFPLYEWPEKFNRILPETCSTNEKSGIVIRSKGNEFLNVTSDALKNAGYSYSDDESGYSYLVKDSQAAFLNLTLATPTDATAIKDIPLATPHNATKSDADKKEYGKATPANAEERKEYSKATPGNADEDEGNDEEYDEPDYDEEEDELDEIPLVNDLILIPEESIELKTTQFSN